jgi:hypothetical protein
MLLLALTIVVVVVVSIPVGCISAATRGSALDYGLRIGSYVAWAVPVFVVAILLQEGLGRIPGGWGTGWFPAVGWAGKCPNGQGIDPHNFRCSAAGHGLTHAGQVIYHLTLPALTLGLGFVGLEARYLRNSMLDVLDAPYITVARGKGLCGHREPDGFLHAYVALAKPPEWIASLDSADPATVTAQVAAEFTGWAPELTALITDGETTPVLRAVNALPIGASCDAHVLQVSEVALGCRPARVRTDTEMASVVSRAARPPGTPPERLRAGMAQPAAAAGHRERRRSRPASSSSGAGAGACAGRSEIDLSSQGINRPPP